MRRKILIAIAIIVSVLLLNQIMYAILVPDRPYGCDWEPMYHVANSKWISDDGRVTLFVDDDYQITGTVVNDNQILEIEVHSSYSYLFIFEYVSDTDEYHLKGSKYEEWLVKRSNSNRMVVKVYHEDDSDVHIFEDRSVITFYRVDNTPQPE